MISLIFSDAICGYVPVAPVGTGEFVSLFPTVSVPTMIVYGSRDTSLGVTSKNHLINLPEATKPQVLEDARHPAYLDRQDDWHTLLYNFMLELDSRC